MIEEKGNGSIVSKEFQVSSFIRLHLAARGVTNLIQAEQEKVVVETDENLLGYIEAANSGRTLYISSDARLRIPVFTHLKIDVYYRQIDTLLIRCDGGEIACGNVMTLGTPLDIKIQSIGRTDLAIDAPSIKITNQCVGDVSLAGKCGFLQIKNQSEGNLFAKELKADELVIRNMADGNVTLTAQETISIFHRGEGFIHYFGKATLKDVKQYGNGIIKRCE